MGIMSARRQKMPCQPVLSTSTPIASVPSVSYSPAAEEASLDGNPPTWMAIRATKGQEPDCHADTITIILPKDKSPAFLYHGRVRSDFAAGTGEAVVSRNNQGLVFSLDDVGVADSCLRIRRKEAPLADGSLGYQYTVAFRKETASNAGARDPGKLAIRVDGIEFAAVLAHPIPTMSSPTPPSFDLKIPSPRLLSPNSNAVQAGIGNLPHHVSPSLPPLPPQEAKPPELRTSGAMGEAIPNRSWDRRPQLTNDDSSWQDRLRRRLGASQDHVPPLTTGPISPQKVESGLEKGVTIANEKLNLALDQLAGRLESKGKETAVTGVTFYVIAANNAETFHYLAATYNSQSKRLIIAGTEQSRSNAKELKTDQLTLVKGSKGAWMLSMEENSNNGKIQPQFRMLDRDEVALSIEGKPGGVNLPLRTEWLNKLALESIKPTWVGRPIDCDSW